MTLARSISKGPGYVKPKLVAGSCTVGLPLSISMEMFAGPTSVPSLETVYVPVMVLVVYRS